MAVDFTTTQDKVEALYVGYFGRAADPAGLNYWLIQLDGGAISYAQAAASFSVQPEATAAYPYLADPSTGDAGTFIDQIYTNVFNRPADADGKAYWQAQLAAHNDPASLGAFILNVISGAQASDAATITNKVAVAGHFSRALSDAEQPYDAAADAEGRWEVSHTDSTAASVAVNQARADSYAATGVAPGEVFTLTTAVENIQGSSGADTFVGTSSDGGSNTFNLGDTLAGNGGIDSLTLTPSDPDAATSLADGLWANVSGIEKLSVTSGMGGISIATGAAFEAAFAPSGVYLTATTTDGAINIDSAAFTGAETLVTSSGAGAQTLVTGSGVANVAATSADGSLAISGAALVGVSAKTTGTGAQTIGDLTGGGAKLVSVTADAGSGAQSIYSTSTSTVTVQATAAGGPQTIVTGSGNDTIIIGSSASTGSINGGGGADSIFLGATHTGVDQITVTPGESSQTAFDTITNFSMTVSDTLSLGSTTMLDSAQLGGGFTVTDGIATADGATLADFLAAATASTTVGVVAFSDGIDTYVVASDGVAAGDGDSLVKLVGITNATAVGTSADATTIHIV
jgi:hypothetical protein